MAPDPLASWGKMTGKYWDSVTFFKPHEWGEWSNVSAELILEVDEFRRFVGKPIFIHEAFARSGHSPRSLHYLGLAVDLHIKGLHVVDQYLLAERFGKFGGIGLYPWWNSPGLHLDLGKKGRRWLRDQEGSYGPVTWQSIRAL